MKTNNGPLAQAERQILVQRHIGTMRERRAMKKYFTVKARKEGPAGDQKVQAITT